MIWQIPKKIDVLIFFALPPNPFTDWITAWLAEVAKTTMLYKANRLLICILDVCNGLSGCVKVPTLMTTTININTITVYFWAIPTAFIPIKNDDTG